MAQADPNNDDGDSTKNTTQIPNAADGDSTNVTQIPNAADGDNVNRSPVEGLTEDQSPPQEPGPEKEEEKNSNDNGPGAVDHVKEDKQPKRSESKKLGPEAALKEIKTQETHNLYCPYCASNITQTAGLFKKGEETSKYNENTILLWFSLLITITQKLPFISLSCPSLFKNTTEPVEVTQGKTHPLPPGPWKKLEKFFPTMATFLWFLLVVVLLLLSVIVMWFLPSTLPPFQRNDTANDILTPARGGKNEVDLSLSWLIHFMSIKYLSVSSLLFLAILVLLRAFIFKASPSEVEEVILPPVISDPNQIQDPAPDTKPSPPPVIDSPIHANEDPAPAPVPAPTPDPDPISIVEKLLKGLRKHIVVPVQNLDILKSIVYGGLIESITSLGVVSSAAASGASTLNVLALGIANLFSGFFLIIHKLCELRANHDQNNPTRNVEGEENLPKKKSRYEEELGNRENFNPHMFVVVVSFIFFGVIPPLVYGLSFKRTDKGHLKAAVVLAASLVCVISLSFAKAYTFKVRKFKTVAEYTGMAIGASALSFIVSHLFSDLLEKYGFHELASDYRKG